jgi:hypothetical protein
VLILLFQYFFLQANLPLVLGGICSPGKPMNRQNHPENDFSTPFPYTK